MKWEILVQIHQTVGTKETPVIQGAQGQKDAVDIRGHPDHQATLETKGPKVRLLPPSALRFWCWFLNGDTVGKTGGI